jgi:hypothetical protein
MPQNQEYIQSIISKLERLNIVDHGSKDPISKQIHSGLVLGEDKPLDIMDWMGRAAIDYLNKKKSNENIIS